VFATHIPGVLADTGGDFSNNLFTDIAPFLALFGDQVAKQYMSHSLSWNEDLIFAIAPLGIITAITSAIRVGGPSSFKAIIGRAREGKGVVEVELMSSTSHDVCELWNGDRVARILGTKEPPSIIELLYSKDSNSNNPEPQERQKHYQAEIYSFESGKLAGVIIPKDRQSVPSSEDTEINANEPPNLGLNIGGQWVSDLELKAIAMVGIILQGGVLAFAGISGPLSLDSKLEKNHKPVQLYSFPLMAAGTVGLIVGMFLCAHIIERSTAETTWTVVNSRINTVSWLQRSTVVNDQQFDSYFIQRQELASGRSHFYKILSYALPTKWLNANPQLQIRKSRKAETNKQQTLTIIATSISVSAFVLQFIGLRGLNGSVTIAQLIVTGVMTVLRAVVRRGLVADEVRCEKLQKGYELDRVAIKITNCCDWYVITGGLQPTTEIRHNELATKVVNARVHLGNLCKWETQWEPTVAATAASIEAVMNFLCKSDDFRLTRLSDVFVWKLVVQVRSESESFEEIRLQMSRTWHEGRGWSDWNVDKSILEAVLGLWMLHYRDQTAPHESLRFLDIKRETYERWIQRQAEDTDDPGRINDWSGSIFGKPITEDSSNLVKVISHAPINKICGQYILSKFVSEVAEKYLISIGGRVWIRSGQLGVKASFGWGNTVLDDLANELERTGLATIQEAFLSIVPPLEKAKKLPTDIDISAAFLDTTKQMATYLDGGRDEQAKRLHLWVLDAAESHASWYESGSKWKDACGVYAHLCCTYDNIKGGEDFVCDAEEFMGLFCERLFIYYSTCPEKNHQALTNTLDLVRATLHDAVNTETWKGRLLKWKTRLQTWNRDIEELPANNLNSLQTLLNASHSGNCLCLARLLELRDLDINTTDSEGRTPLILATIAGHATIASLLLQRKAKSDVQDNDSSSPGVDQSGPVRSRSSPVQSNLLFGPDQTEPYARPGPSGLVESLVQDNNKRTALHYAAINGYTPILHTLLRYIQTPHKIDIKDVLDKSPMDLAIENNQAAAVSLLIFYGVGCDAMHTAARRGNNATIRLLHACGANIQLKSSDKQLTALHMASGKGHEATVQLLVDLGASIQTVDNNNLNALHRAAQYGHDGTVQLLLDRGAKIQAPCRDNNGTALHLACQNGHTATVRLLLEYGANIQAMARGNLTVLHLAADRGYTDVVQLLIDSGANISTRTERTNWTALHLAATKGREDTVRLLINRGAKIETTGMGNRTALHSAAENGQQGIVRLLLDCRADIEATCTICDNDNGTALHLAAQNGYEAILLLLLDRNADIEAASRDDQWTALHLAADKGHVHIVRQLLDHGANRDRKGGNDYGWAAPQSGSGNTASMPINNGRTALELAQDKGHDDTVQLLRSHHATMSGLRHSPYHGPAAP